MRWQTAGAAPMVRALNRMVMMLGVFRGFLSTLPAKIFFGVLAAAFALWGVANKNPFGEDDNATMTVAGQAVPLADIQQSFRQQLAQAARQVGQAEASPELRRVVAEQTVERMATQAALRARVDSLGLAVPDSALRDAAFAIPAFRGKDGKYDRATMLDVLRQNGLTEARFLDILHSDLGQQQLLAAAQAGSRPPDQLARQVYLFQQEKRAADIVELPFAKAVPPAEPTDPQLRRWYANHPDSYSTPELRHIKAIVLSPETVAKDVAVTDDELRAGWETHKGEFAQPARRSVQVLSGLADAEAAERLRTQWIGGADWTAMQHAAEQAGGASVALDDATRGEFPAPELADAAFLAAAETIAPPVKSALGWYVVRVTKAVAGGDKTFEDARDALRTQLATEKAADQILDRVSRIEDVLSGGSKLADLPGDIGVAPITGTLDAHGNTATGEPAPIPGGLELRAALIDAAFAAPPGEAAKLVTVPGKTRSYFALEVESITKPAARPYDDVAAAVRADWHTDAVRRVQDAAAAGLLAGIQSGHTLSGLTGKADLAIRRLAATGRDDPAAGVPPPLVTPLFGLKLGEATMIETPEGFIVAVLADISRPDPARDPIGFARVRESLERGVAQDVQASFAAAVRAATPARVSARVVPDLVQAGN